MLTIHNPSRNFNVAYAVCSNKVDWTGKKYIFYIVQIV
jgi:hypothetical protein